MTATLGEQGPTNAYRLSGEAVLETDAVRGLSEPDARVRLERVERNELASEPPIPAWRRFLGQFENILVILLLVATAISAGVWWYERDPTLPYEALAILAVVMLNAIIGYVQRHGPSEQSPHFVRCRPPTRVGCGTAVVTPSARRRSCLATSS